MMKGYGYGGMSSGKKKDGGTAGGQALFDALKAKGYKELGGAQSALTSAMNGYIMKSGGSCGKVRKGCYYRRK